MGCADRGGGMNEEQLRLLRQAVEKTVDNAAKNAVLISTLIAAALLLAHIALHHPEVLR